MSLPRSRFHVDPDPAEDDRASRIALSVAAFVLFAGGCLLLAFSQNLMQTGAGIALECISGLMVAGVRDRFRRAQLAITMTTILSELSELSELSQLSELS